MEENKLLNFVMDKEKSPIIKIIGVGGGGGNAVNQMYRQGIHDVAFVVCNTDYQALINSPVPTKIQLGGDTTGGLGAGAVPEKARNAALESLPEIEQILKENTKMVFITATMGGGTGTGAAPIIAKAAKDLGILTVGIVTIPFNFEGRKKRAQAIAGIEEIEKHVDTLLIIDNQKLISYEELDYTVALAKSDDVLINAAKGISELITVNSYINIDFADVDTTLRDSGVAIMKSGRGSGEKRITQALNDAINSPLLNNKDINSAKKILFHIYSPKDNQVKTTELEELEEFVADMWQDLDVIWGIASVDDIENDEVKITLIATGFKTTVLTEEPSNTNKKEEEPEKVVINIDDLDDDYFTNLISK